MVFKVSQVWNFILKWSLVKINGDVMIISVKRKKKTENRRKKIRKGDDNEKVRR